MGIRARAERANAELRVTGPDPLEVDQAKLLLRYAAQELTAKQRFAIRAFMHGWNDVEAGKMVGATKQAIYEARKVGLRKMRRRLEELRIRSSADLLTADVG